MLTSPVEIRFVARGSHFEPGTGRTQKSLLSRAAGKFRLNATADLSCGRSPIQRLLATKMYTQTTAIAISSILFVFMLIGFVAQTAGSRAERYDFFAFDNVSEVCGIFGEF